MNWPLFLATAEDASVEVEHAAGGAGMMDISAPMMALTWVTFLLLALVLYKFAWKPLLAALTHREDSIRRSLETAENARKEAEAAAVRHEEAAKKARQEAKAIVDDARSTAATLAKTVDENARREAKALVEEARREISAATSSARETLRKEVADLSIAIASKMIQRNIDESSNRKLAEDMLKDS